MPICSTSRMAGSAFKFCACRLLYKRCRFAAIRADSLRNRNGRREWPDCIGNVGGGVGARTGTGSIEFHGTVLRRRIAAVFGKGILGFNGVARPFRRLYGRSSGSVAAFHPRILPFGLSRYSPVAHKVPVLSIRVVIGAVGNNHDTCFFRIFALTLKSNLTRCDE